MASCTIRKAESTDLLRIKAILKEAQLGEQGLEDHFSNFFVAELEHEIIGTIGIELYGKKGLVRSAAVKEKYQRQGIGEHLIDALKHYAKEKNIEELLLLTTTAADYFQSRGFTRIRSDAVTGNILQSEQFRGACPTSAITMRMEL